MGRELHVAATAHGRLMRVGAWLAARAPSEECVLVTHESTAGAALLRSLVADPSRGGGAAFGRHRTTLTGLAASLAAPVLAARGLVPAGRLAAEAVLTRALHRQREAGALGRLLPVVDGPGLPRALLAVIRELREEQAPSVAAHDPVLQALRRAYEDELAAAALVDRADLLTLAAEVARDGAAAHPWLHRPLALLDVAVGTRAEAALLAAVVARAPDVLATVPAGDEVSCAHLVRALGCAATPLPDDADASPTLARLAAGLFADRAPDPASAQRASPGALGDHVTILSAPGEGRECVEIMRRVLRFARAGVPFDRMAVLLRAPELYRDHLEEAADRAGVPVHLLRGVRRPDPGGRALAALLACAAEGLSARRFAEYLSLGEVPAPRAGRPPPALTADERFAGPSPELAALLGRPHGDDEPVETAALLAHAFDDDPDPLPAPDEGEAATAGDDTTNASASHAAPLHLPLPSPRRWERLLVEASVVGGYARWAERLSGLRRQMEHSLGGLDDPDDPLDPRAAALRRDIDALAALAGFALPLLDDLAALPAAATWGEWIDALSALATRALRHPAHVLEVLGEMLPMAALGPVPLEHVRLVLGERLLSTTVRSGDDPAGRVAVLPIDAVRGRSFDVVFVPGLAERVFPGRIAEDPILGDATRALLDAGLVDNARRLADERLLLRLAVGAARRHLVLSYPRLDQEQARPRVPSFYALEALRAAEGTLPGFDELAARAETTADTRLGWPAPSRPEDAIDEAEHDLSLLDSLLSRPELENVGTARFLLSANPHLGRALRFRAGRWLPGWTPFDGLVKPDPRALAALHRHRLDARPWSVTALQHFSACPYRFLLAGVLRLAPREEPAGIEILDPLQRGALVHGVLRELLQRLHDAGALPLRPAGLDDARALLDEVLDAHAAQARDDLVPAIGRVWDEGIALIRADLREWLRRQSLDASGFVGERFELAFGLPARDGFDAHSSPEPVRLLERLVLRGAVDMVERHPDGRLRVTDHKTGKLVTRRDAVVDGGRTLQPVFYALAVEQLVPGAVVSGGRLASCTSAGGYEERVVPLDDKARQAAEQVVGAIGAALEQGFLPAAPAKNACRWCDYRVVCGPYEELRTARKKGRLLSLRALRDLT